MIVIELLIFLSTVLPIFHLFNALLTHRKKQECTPCPEKPFSVLIPCYNEEDTVRSSLKGLLSMDYKCYEALYINDGSTDNTLGTLHGLLNLIQVTRPAGCPPGVNAVYRSKRHPHIRVIDQCNGGKSEALNAAIQLARADLVVTLDADSVLDKNALPQMNRAFEDGDLVAAGGAIHIMQGYDPSNLKASSGRTRAALISLQILEYLKGFYLYKLSLSKQHATAIISGAFGVFRRNILFEIGGFRKTLGEDIDITMRIQQLIRKTGHKILYLPEALCYTQCPENWHDLVHQRLRWQKGFVDCAHYHRRFLLRTFLCCSLSFHFFVEALIVGLCSCLFTLFTYVFAAALAVGDPHTLTTFLMYFAFCLIFNLIYSLSAFVVSARYNHYPKPMVGKAVAAILLDILFYRYFTLFMYLGGTLLYFCNHTGNSRWNKVARTKCECLAATYKGGCDGQAAG